MLLASMAIFAVVISVGALGVALLTMSASARTERNTASWISHVNNQVKATSTATLAQQVDDLAAALDALRASNRKEMGKYWARLASFEEGPQHNHVDESGGDPDLQQMLDLQAQRSQSNEG